MFSNRPEAVVPFLCGASSIASLLLYFYGAVPMGTGTRWILLPAILTLGAFLFWCRRSGRHELFDRVIAGLWAGGLATLAYDLVRVPIVIAGTPVFKAISYFGTVILDQAAPTAASEVIGWSYHLSNGIGFGLMYAVALTRPRLWAALAWGVLLEAIMLLTPYAEVFGYRLSPKFLVVTVGSHLVYGAVLWAALRLWRKETEKSQPATKRAFRLIALALLPPLGIGAIAWDFHARHARSIPPSPPGYLGDHLYTTWNTLEPDRIAVLWLTRRFVDPEARFHFVEPFTQIRFGIPIDLPEAEVRRSGTESATERLLAELELEDDPKLRLLARTAYLFEIARWKLPAEPEAFALGQGILAAAGECAPAAIEPCVERGLRYLDDWYGGR